MSPRMSMDIALCIPAVPPGDARDLSVGQRELLNAVQASSLVPEIIRLSRLPEGIALKELEALLRGGWVIPLNPTLSGGHAIDMPMSGASTMTPSTVKGFVSPDDLAAAHTQRTFNVQTMTSRSEQEMDAALERLTEMSGKLGETASVFAPPADTASVAPKTPQVNARSGSHEELPAQRSLPPGNGARSNSVLPGAVETRASIKASPIRTVAVGGKPTPAPTVAPPVAVPPIAVPAAVAPAAAPTPQVPPAGAAPRQHASESTPALVPDAPPARRTSTQPVLNVEPAWLAAPQPGERKSYPPLGSSDRRSSNPGDRRSPIPLPSEIANERRSPLPRLSSDRSSPLPAAPAVGSSKPTLAAPVLAAEPNRGESNDNFVFLLGPKSSPPLSPFPPAPSGELDLSEPELLHSLQERTVSDIESLRRGSSRPPPNVSDVQALNLPGEFRMQAAVAASGSPDVGGTRPAPRSSSSDKLQREELVPGEPVPLVRITRRASPAFGIRAPDRVVAIGPRDGGNRPAQSPLPAPAPQQTNPNPPRLAGGTLVGGMHMVRVAAYDDASLPSPPGDLYEDDTKSNLEHNAHSPEPHATSANDSVPPRSEPLNRESGRTLLGGSYAGAIAAANRVSSGQMPAVPGQVAPGQAAAPGQVVPGQTAPSLPAQRTIGMSRMVVVGERAPAAVHNPATQQSSPAMHGAATQPRLGGKTAQTLLGVPTPEESELQGFGFGEQAANDTPEPRTTDDSDNLDHFEVIESLARGGSGVVYRVRDPKAPAGEFLALKVLRQGNHRSQDAIDALAREATLMATLEHPSLVKLHDFGHEGDEPFLLMECIDGLSMSELLHHPVPMPLDVGLIIIQDTLEVLDYVHRQSFPDNERRGIIHCDVSPQNLLVGRDGRTRLIDFGIARTPGSPIGDSLVRCKPRYASPELLAGEDVDATTDVFAVGAVLFQVLSKVPAFSSDPDRRKRESLVPNPSKLNSRAPSRFDPICHRALAHDRMHRYSTPREMLADINTAVELSGILLRRERVMQWVQGVVQALTGELVELTPDQVKEFLSENKSSSEHSSPMASSLRSDPPEQPVRRDSQPTEGQKRKESRAPRHATLALPVEADDDLPPVVKKALAGIAGATLVAILVAAAFNPRLFGSLFVKTPPPEASAEPAPSATAPLGEERKLGEPLPQSGAAPSALGGDPASPLGLTPVPAPTDVAIPANPPSTDAPMVDGVKAGGPKTEAKAEKVKPKVGTAPKPAAPVVPAKPEPEAAKEAPKAAKPSEDSATSPGAQPEAPATPAQPPAVSPPLGPPVANSGQPNTTAP